MNFERYIERLKQPRMKTESVKYKDCIKPQLQKEKENFLKNGLMEEFKLPKIR